MRIPRPFFRVALGCFRRGFRRVFALVNLALLGVLRKPEPKKEEYKL